MLVVSLKCTKCGKEHPVNIDIYRSMEFGNLPKKCPECNDVIQQRPDIVLERRELSTYTVKIDKSFVDLFNKAEKFQPLPTDIPTYRLVKKGSEYGASWSGRIDIYSHVWPVTEDMTCEFSYMSCTRKVWIVTKTRRGPGNGGYVHDISETRRVHRGYVPVDGEGPLSERTETNEYVVLTPTVGSASAALQRDALPHLVWCTAHTKTTLKGFGRQFHAHIVGDPLWSWSVSGACRSRRYDTHGMLAVVDPIHPLRVVVTGDGEETTYYPGSKR